MSPLAESCIRVTRFRQNFRGKYVAGDLLGHAVYWHDIEPYGSTVRTSHGGELLESADTWFAPTDITMGPDGAIYVSDWHDARTAHPDPDADWDRTNGRIYLVASNDTPRTEPIDFAKLSPDELLALHQHANQWYVRRARMELATRSSISERISGVRVLRKRLRKLATTAPDEAVALEALWSLQAVDGFQRECRDRVDPEPSCCRAVLDRAVIG